MKRITGIGGIFFKANDPGYFAVDRWTLSRRSRVEKMGGEGFEPPTYWV
jgi:hypothetical protein